MTGNYTTDDSYRGRMVGNNSVVTRRSPTTRPSHGSSPGRIRTRPLRNAFTPGSPTGAVPPFVARVVDPRGCLHFVVISNAVGTATSVTLTFARARSAARPSSCRPRIRAPAAPATRRRSRSIRCRRSAGRSGRRTPALAPDAALGETGNKFDLFREILDAAGAAVPSPGGPQVVAEYAIDLKFGLSVDSPDAALLPPANQLTFDMDTGRRRHRQVDAGGVGHGDRASRRRTGFVRFVSALATRAALPDRDAPLSLAPRRRTSRATARRRCARARSSRACGRSCRKSR